MNLSFFTPYVIFDLALLAILLVSLILFLKRNKSNLKKEGILYLYKTSWGIKLINTIGSKYKRTLKFLSYVSVVLGYFLMAGILYLIGNTFWSYLTKPEMVEIIRAPPLAPLIPYFPAIFGLSDFFPPLYAVYFIVAILIVATVHEFSHGIFAKRYGVKIKSTGFAFLKYFPVILGAFVEQDEKDMTKRKRFEQMSILSAGVFANVVVAVIFFILLIGYFTFAFTASGLVPNSYAYSLVGISAITSINGISLENPSYNTLIASVENLENETSFIKVKTDKKAYLATKVFLDAQNQSRDYIALYEDAPAINAGLKGFIIGINDVEITDAESLGKELNKYSPGEKVIIKTRDDGNFEEYEIILGENPSDKNLPYLGIFLVKEQNFILKEGVHFLTAFKSKNLYFKENTYYQAKSGFSEFGYYLIWWIVLINILVALFNMLPLGILDGGRFFYLTVWKITGSEKFAKQSFSFFTYVILFGFAALMVRWAFSFF